MFMRSIKVLSAPSFLVLTGCIALFSLAIHWGNRLAFHVPSLPTSSDLVSAKWTFLSGLLAGYGIPLLLVFLTARGKEERWPIAEAIILGVGTGFGLMSLSVDLSIPNQDIVGSCVAYVSAFISYAFAILKTISSIETARWRNSLANGALALLAATVIFIVSGAIVYFE